jgi:hypothetical protein
MYAIKKYLLNFCTGMKVGVALQTYDEVAAIDLTI